MLILLQYNQILRFMPFCFFTVDQASSNLATPAEFSSYPNQTHLSMLINVFKIIKKSQVGEFDQVGAKLCSRLTLQGKIWGTLH